MQGATALWDDAEELPLEMTSKRVDEEIMQLRVTAWSSDDPF